MPKDLVVTDVHAHAQVAGVEDWGRRSSRSYASTRRLTESEWQNREPWLGVTPGFPRPCNSKPLFGDSDGP